MFEIAHGNKLFLLGGGSDENDEKRVKDDESLLERDLEWEV
jgi:hypothetical protein